MHRLTVFLDRQRGCVARAQVRAAGASDGWLDETVRAGRLIPIHRGVVRLPTADPSDPRVAAWAALLTQARGPAPGVVVGYVTAARLFGIDGAPPDNRVHLVVPATWTSHHRPGVVLHRTTLPPSTCDVLDGLPVTGAALTVAHLAGTLPATTAVALADGALRLAACSRGDLVRVAGLLRGRGCARARAVAAASRPGVDSWPESILRLLLVGARLPEPVVAHSVPGPHGRTLARADLAYPDRLVWIEYDGYPTHSGREAFRRDRARQNWLVGRGWLVLRYADTDLSRPARVAGQVAAALGGAAARVAALPAGLSPEADAARSLG